MLLKFQFVIGVRKMANGSARQVVSRRVVALCFVITLRWLFAACGACSVLLMLPFLSCKRRIFSAECRFSSEYQACLVVSSEYSAEYVYARILKSVHS